MSSPLQALKQNVARLIAEGNSVVVEQPVRYAYAPIAALPGVLKCQGIFSGTNMDAIVYRKDFTADQVVVLAGYRGDRIVDTDFSPYRTTLADCSTDDVPFGC